MQPSSSPGVLRRYFTGITEQTFQTQLGVVDPPVVDYLSDLLVRFVRYDAIFRVRNLAGRPLEQVADMLLEAEERVGDARREVHRHIGDFTLFWTGVFPEGMRHLRSGMKKDALLDYQSQGKRAYFIASTIEIDEDEEPPAEVLERLSHTFELCAYGLREVRRHWDHREGDDDLPRPLLL